MTLEKKLDYCWFFMSCFISAQLAIIIYDHFFWTKECLQNNIGQYNSQTGKFELGYYDKEKDKFYFKSAESE